MGISSSKAKSSHVTLVKSSCSVDELPDDGNATPLRKVLPFDPRSPTENFSRTPIVVAASSAESTPAGTTNTLSVRVLDIDPRSPSQQVSRTPITVERSSSFSDTPKSCGVRTKPHALHSPDESLLSTEDTDPRSPTETVPRTPLEQKLFKVSIEDTPTVTANATLNRNAQTSEVKSTSTGQINDDATDKTELSSEENEKENQPETYSCREGKKGKENSTLSGPRSPLSCSNRHQSSTPRNLLQAKQCRTLEEEFTKNQRNILAQISPTDDEEAVVVPSTTQFVEQI